jgi:hypothetical protein
LRLFRGAKAPLRYFLYISDARLDMLFEQIGLGLRGASALKPQSIFLEDDNDAAEEWISA